ncbi:MAG: hypothetical protein WDW38_009910 [Sanguina aurantia]
MLVDGRDVRPGLDDWSNTAAAWGVRPDIVDGVRGVFATFPVPAGSTVLSVPSSISLTLAPGENTPDANIAPPAVWALLPWFGQLALKLCVELSLGSKSPLQPYLALLPAEIDLPACWREEDLLALQNVSMVRRLQEEQLQWRAMHDSLPLSQQRPTWERFQWALCNVRSRSFAGPHFNTPFTVKVNLALALGAVAALQQLGVPQVVEALSWPAAATAALAAILPAAWFYADSQGAQTAVRYSMCPFLDLLNHDGSVQAECAYDPFGDCFKVVADRALSPKQQLTINYGSQSNDRLLQVYGFVEPVNESDRYLMTDVLQLLQQGALRGVATQAQVQQLGIPPSLLSEVTLTTAGFPTEVVQALQKLLDSSPNSPTSSQQPLTVNNILAELCNTELLSLGSTLDQDISELSKLRAQMARIQARPALEAARAAAAAALAAAAAAATANVSGAAVESEASVEEADGEGEEEEEELQEFAERRRTILLYRTSKKALLTRVLGDLVARQ